MRELTYIHYKHDHNMTEEAFEELYLSVEQFKRFLSSVPKLEIFHTQYHKLSPMTPYQWQVYFAFIYYTCIRPGAEALRIKKKDINLETRIITATNKKGGFKKTTIPPPLLEVLKQYLKHFKDDDYLFSGSRQSFWNYTKKIGELARIKYFEEFEKRTTEGLYLYVFKHAYIQRLEMEGCPGSLISIKSRHRPDGRMARQTVNYAKSLRGLKIWEQQHITERLDIIG